MFKCKFWLENSAGPLKFFTLTSSQQMSSHYKSSEGRTNRSGNPQTQILHNSKKLVISLSTFIAML